MSPDLKNARAYIIPLGGKDADNDTVEQFGGVEQMDPVEAYVQQMVASGYDEQTARQYAEQYYASYYAQQKGGN